MTTQTATQTALATGEQATTTAAKKARTTRTAKKTASPSATALTRSTTAAARAAALERLTALESELLTADMIAILDTMPHLAGMFRNVAANPKCPWSCEAINALAFLLDDLAGRFESELPHAAHVALGLARGCKWAEVVAYRSRHENDSIPADLARAAIAEAEGRPDDAEHVA